MRGRLSLDKAKAIREKRELATELGTPLLFYGGERRVSLTAQRGSGRF